MTVTELTKEIYDKYPDVWKRIKEYFDFKKVSKKTSFYYLESFDEYNNFPIIICCIEDDRGFTVPFSMLYGLLEGFFEENGIIINIIYQHDILEDKHYYYQHVYLNYKWIEGLLRNESKLVAKQQAILKACEILENKLKGDIKL